MRKPALRVVSNTAEQTEKIYLYGVIGDYWADGEPLTAKRFMRELAALQGSTRVDIHLNSPGGSVHEGLAICNAIKASKLNIHTYNDGLAASMAAVILASAKDGNRHAAKGSITMIHSASSIAWGNKKTMEDTAEMLGKHDDVLAEFFADAMGKTVQEIKDSYMDSTNHWLTASEAAETGLVAIADYEAEKMPENIKDMSMERVAAFFHGDDGEPSQSFMDKVVANIDKIKDLIKPKNEMSKFSRLVALAAVAAEAITADQMKSVNDEIQAEGIKGVTAVLDSELTALRADAEKAKGIEAKDKEIADLKAEVKKEQDAKAALQAKLDAAAEDPTTPTAVKPDVTPEPTKVEDSYETSFDREVKAALGK